MELSKKSLTLRRAQGLPQEALAEQLHISRQAVPVGRMGYRTL